MQRSYNKSYSDYHSIDCFFQSGGRPYYFPSCGMEVPEGIKVKVNKAIQTLVYSDVCKKYDYENGWDHIEQHEYMHFMGAFHCDSRPEDDFYYLRDSECVFDRTMLLSSIYGDNTEDRIIDDEEVLLYMYSYIPMLRRGFTCLLPTYHRGTIRFETLFMPLAEHDRTMASLFVKSKVLPTLDDFRESISVNRDAMVSCGEFQFRQVG